MEETRQPRSIRTARIAVVLVVVGLLLTAQQLGILAQFSSASEVKQSLLRFGSGGYVVYVLAFTLIQPFGIPGTVFMIAASLVWPWPVAYALSMTGAMGSSVVGFVFCRFVARDWVSKRIPARFERHHVALEQRGFVTVVILRFFFWMAPMLHAFLGVSKVPFWTHIGGTFIGYLVPIFLVSFLGQELFNFFLALPTGVWIAIGSAMVLFVLWVWRRSRRAASERGSLKAREAKGPVD